LRFSPIRNSESLEQGTRPSEEVHVSHSFKYSLRVEKLGVNMELDVRLFVELVHVEILYSDSYSYKLELIEKSYQSLEPFLRGICKSQKPSMDE
jgi:hypothetical protein